MRSIFTIFLLSVSAPSFAESLGECEQAVRADLHRRLARQEISIGECNPNGALLVCEGGASNGEGAGDISYVIGVNKKCKIIFYRETGRE